ncbi:hypothetical protein L228DRAFT_26766 [Xylona heveae TC161]|uniref:Uncharacterized protein n=1 Tax=Xylona heveae (strain CBS 132557 / TC161) TaxID=1328760 RepID=A0A165AF07_XYLHT|nr:hypothetical protein L228DRAFT_26766 [Xylona heveae TC161]KZF20369.1 hypothetical protein L228DRAFT_26766 [Xylona heveae TC161]
MPILMSRHPIPVYYLFHFLHLSIQHIMAFRLSFFFFFSLSFFLLFFCFLFSHVWVSDKGFQGSTLPIRKVHILYCNTVTCKVKNILAIQGYGVNNI